METIENRPSAPHAAPNAPKGPDARATARTRARYGRLAPFYDRMEARAEAARFRGWRTTLWSQVRGPRVLELGVGTGKNFPYYPPHVQVTAVDLTPGMLARARARARREQVAVQLALADAQALPFADASFETVVATFVFCSVPDPVLGLREAYRVLVPGGQLLLLEHVVSQQRLLNRLMHLANPLVVRMMGANIDRDTVTNVRLAGFTLTNVTSLWHDIVKRIEAQQPKGQRETKAPSTVATAQRCATEQLI